MRARCIDLSVDLGIVKKSGAWFTYEGEQLGQGRENAKNFLIAEPRDHGRDQRPGADRRRAQARPGCAESMADGVEAFTRRRRGADRARTDRLMATPARVSLVTLGRRRRGGRPPRSTRRSGWRRSSASMDVITFFNTSGPVLGLFGREDLAEDATVDSGRAAASVASRCRSTWSRRRAVDEVFAEWVGRRGHVGPAAGPGRVRRADASPTSPIPTVTCGSSPTTRTSRWTTTGRVLAPD